MKEAFAEFHGLEKKEITNKNTLIYVSSIVFISLNTELLLLYSPEVCLEFNAELKSSTDKQ